MFWLVLLVADESGMKKDVQPKTLKIIQIDWPGED